MQPDIFLKQLKQKGKINIFEYIFVLKNYKLTSVENTITKIIETYQSPEESFHVYRNIIGNYKNKSKHNHR